MRYSHLRIWKHSISYVRMAHEVRTRRTLNLNDLVIRSIMLPWHPFYPLGYAPSPRNFLSIDALPVNRCVQPGSSAPRSTSLRICMRILLLPLRDTAFPAAGCGIDWSTCTYLCHKTFRHKGGGRAAIQARAQCLLDRCVPAVRINLHSAILTWGLFHGARIYAMKRK